MLAPLLALTALLTVTASPEGPGAPVQGGLSLDEAVRMALENNAGLAALEADAEEARAGLAAARARRWPLVQAEAGWHRSDNPVVVFGDKLTSGEFTADDFRLDRLNRPASLDHGTVGVGVELPIDISGRIRSAVSAAEKQELAMRAGHQAARAHMVVRVTEAYFGISLARAAVDVAESTLESAWSHEKKAEARVKEGSALQSDLLRTRVERLARERDLARRQADLDVARARLRMVLGAGDRRLPDPSEALGAPADSIGSIDQWTNEAIRRRPDVDAARQATEAAEAASSEAWARRRPELAGMAKYERNTGDFSAGEGSYLVGLKVRWSAFDRGRAPGTEAAMARAEAAKARQRSLEDEVRLQVEEAYRNAQVADRSLEAAREGARAAEEARRITTERYGAGLLPLTDLLDTEAAALSARLAEISALYQSAVSRVRLEWSAGLLEVPR